jgi:hypothetical protein
VLAGRGIAESADASSQLRKKAFSSSLFEFAFGAGPELQKKF